MGSRPTPQKRCAVFGWLKTLLLSCSMLIAGSAWAQSVTQADVKNAKNQAEAAVDESKAAAKELAKADKRLKAAVLNATEAEAAAAALKKKTDAAPDKDKGKLATDLAKKNDALQKAAMDKAAAEQQVDQARNRMDAAKKQAGDLSAKASELDAQLKAEADKAVAGAVNAKRTAAEAAAAAAKAQADQARLAKEQKAQSLAAQKKAEADKLLLAQQNMEREAAAKRADADRIAKEVADRKAVLAGDVKKQADAKLAAEKAVEDYKKAKRDEGKALKAYGRAKDKCAEAETDHAKADALVQRLKQDVPKATTEKARAKATAALADADSQKAHAKAAWLAAQDDVRQAQLKADQTAATATTLQPSAETVLKTKSVPAVKAVAPPAATVTVSTAAAPSVSAVKVAAPPAATVAASTVAAPLLAPVAKPPPPEDKGVSLPWTQPKEVEPPPQLVNQKTITPSSEKPQPIEAPQGTPDKQQFDVAMVSGDKEIVEKLDCWQEWSEHVTFNPVSVAEINAFREKLLAALQKDGYIFADVKIPSRVWANGIFLAKVDCGPLGTITVKGNRHYSAKQVISSLSRGDAGRFNYARFYQDLFDLNAKPNLLANTKLKPAMQDGRRVINADMEVKDSYPIHGSVEVANSGTDQTNDWRFHSTIQHLNLTKHDDVLTLDWITSPQIGDVNAWSGGYFYPIDRERSVNFFGGYSTSDINDVLPLLDIRGQGYYGGGQFTKTVQETQTHRLQISAGWLYQRFQNKHELNSVVLMDHDIAVSMPSVTVGYASRVYDKYNGRNFLSNTVMANFGGNFGSSEYSDVSAEGRGFAKADFVIDRFQYARMQRLFKGEDEPGRWTAFMRLDGQIASDPLTAGLQKAVGGANSVRGYREQDVSGDDGYVASVEFRTPLVQNFIPGLRKDEKYLNDNPEAWQQHRLQFLFFFDYGLVQMKNPLPGEQADKSLASVGAGLRLGLTRYSQFRFDWGIPIMKTEESQNRGRGHVSLQLQF